MPTSYELRRVELSQQEFDDLAGRRDPGAAYFVGGKLVGIGDSPAFAEVVRNESGAPIGLIDPATGQPVGVGGSGILTLDTSFRRPSGASAATPPQLLPIFAEAALQARAGGRCIISVVSDSTGCGYDGSYIGKKPQNLAHTMSGYLRAAGFDVNLNTFMGSQNVELTGATVPQYDKKLSFTGSMTTLSINTVGCYAFYLANGNSGTLVYQPDQPYDTIEFFYATDLSASNGSIAVSNGGATLGDYPCNTATSTLTRQVISVAMNQNPVTITRGATAGNIYPVGLILRNSQRAQITLVNCGWNGGKISDLAVNTKGYNYPGGYGVIDPDLTVFGMLINDWRAATSLPTFNTNTQAFITTAKAVGDVMLLTAVPSDASQAPIATQDAYVAAYRTLADTNGLPLVDMYAAIGSYTAGNAAGLYSDTFHPNKKGYARQARAVGVPASIAASAAEIA